MTGHSDNRAQAIRRAYMLSDEDRDVVAFALAEQVEITKAARDILYGQAVEAGQMTDEIVEAGRAAWQQQIDKLEAALARFDR